MSTINGNSIDYSIAGETLNGTLNTDAMDTQAGAGAYSVNFVQVYTTLDLLRLMFDGPPTAGDQTIGDAIVGAHDGAALVGSMFSEQNTPDTNATATWQEFDLLTTPPLAPGPYTFSATANVMGSAMDTRIGVRFVIDGNIPGQPQIDFLPTVIGALVPMTYQRHFTINAVLAVQHTVSLQFSLISGSGTVTLSSSVMEVRHL